MMNIIVWIIFGGIAGWVASKIMNTDAEQGLVGNVVVGIIGALIGGYIIRLFTGSDQLDTFSIGGLLTAILGAVILLFLVKAISGSNRTRI